MRHRLPVVQDENHTGDFWYTICAGNGETIATSKMYRRRWLATRAARRFIASIDPVPVTFRFWTGPTLQQDVAAFKRGRFFSGRRRRTERIR